MTTLALTDIDEGSVLAGHKIAVTATRAVGGAVDRNRAKRRLRAAAATISADMRQGFMTIYGSTSETRRVNFQKLVTDLKLVSGKVGALLDA